eukprot:9489084-Pyramimonas_sp.AAC.1
MWLSPGRREHVVTLARASRIEGGSFSKCGSRISAAHILLHKLQESQGFPRSAYQKWLKRCSNTIPGRQDATIKSIRGV